MPSKKLPAFRAQIALAKSGDADEAVNLRVEMIGLMAVCPDPILIRLAETLADCHAEEWRRFHEQS